MSRLPNVAAFWLVSTLTLLPSGAHAQASAVVDEGTFMVTQKGVPLGRESFRIKRAPGPGGQAFLATGESALGERRATTSLGTDSLGVPVSYEAKLLQGRETVQQVQGRGRPGRFSLLVQTKSGESAREYVLNNGALLLDDDVFHQLYFVPLAAQHANVVVISPRAAEQARYKLEERGREDVSIAGRNVAGRRFTLTDAAGSSREVWVDAQGRVLKVSVPAKGLIALRDDPPR